MLTQSSSTLAPSTLSFCYEDSTPTRRDAASCIKAYLLLSALGVRTLPYEGGTIADLLASFMSA